MHGSTVDRGSLCDSSKKTHVQSVQSGIQVDTSDPIIESTLFKSAELLIAMSLLAVLVLLLLPFVSIVMAEEICATSKVMGFVTSPYVATCMSDVGSKLVTGQPVTWNCH